MSVSINATLADSSFLSTYMGSHPSTLVAYATYFGGVQERLESAKMTSINSRVGVTGGLLYA